MACRTGYSVDLLRQIDDLAHKMADAARATILPYFRTHALGTESKARNGFDPVTVADRAAEQVMRDILGTHRPQDAVLGEEFGASPGSSGFTWVLDPIDGTRGFISGTPTWGVLIAVSDAEGPFHGLIDQPFIGERFTGSPTGGFYRGPHGSGPLQCRSPRPIAESTLFTTFPEVGSETERAAFQAVSARARLTRYGMDCYAYALLASGQIDLVIEAGLQPYDIQAPIAVIEAAGGIVTNWAGGPAHQGGRVLAAANRDIHTQAMAELAQALS